MDAHNSGFVPGLAVPSSGNSLVGPPLGADPRAAALESATPADGPALLRNKDQESGHRDFASDEANRKAIAKMTARAALVGCTLHDLPDGGYLVTRWSWCKPLADLRSVGDLLRKIGGRQ